jgi:DHA2 family multidrug resistance protein
MAVSMNGLDTTVVNVALPHMQGNLSASAEQITWVITSYIVATAVAIPASGWLAARLGIKPMLLMSIAGFTVTSVLCGLATNLPEMVLFRGLQGATGAPLAPLAQAVLFNINPPERYGRAMAIFTMATVLAPVVGPVIGGYLTEDYSWRWCFYINIPGGVASMLLISAFFPGARGARRRLDGLGFGSLAIAVGAFQLMLDRGTTQDWFSSNEICLEAIIAGFAFWIYLVHTLTAEHPLFPSALFRDRNLVTNAIFGFFFMGIMFSSLIILPLLMQELLGYPVIYTGMLSTPRGVVMLGVLQVMGRLDTMMDRRVLVATGMAFIAVAFWQMSFFDLSMGAAGIVWATILQGIGQGIIFVPMATLGFSTIAPALRPDASAAANLVRNIGGAVGVASIQALTAINSQTMHASLAAQLRANNPVLHAALPQFLWPETAEGALALNTEITRQATMVAYVDDFRLMAVVCLFCIPLAFLFRQPRGNAAANTRREAAMHA